MVNSDTPVSQIQHQFNYCPCSYIDESWVSEKQPWLLRLQGWREQATINQWCIEEWQLSSITDHVFNHPFNSLALLPAEATNRLLLMIGGAMYCESMRQVVLKQPKQCLNHVFGVDETRFLIQQGPMMISNWPSGWQKSLPPTLDEASFEKTARELGYLWIRFLLAKSPSELVQRWQFKLERSLTQTTLNADWLDETHRDLAYRLIKKIAKQVIPQWFHLLK
ncbi:MULTISPECIES: SctK family type III secretion system sorting platform protein VscK [Vibrio]|uniref:YOP s translocation K family protein n=2 Tax=Vibrio harveyi TaxID=669 RepID=A0A454D2M1_VIBHA|nr:MULTISPECIES: SctK family type III secretion system sorting platform protein VscK [Vibrio]MCG7513514.1 SctK family type III secretion system sorting platform protein VscK [Vibrio sp. MMH1-50]APP06939.1 type III secretion protein [Vibrio harveyi]AWB01152.1 type III secretion protein [Vibrio harveyi]EKM14289.1 YOP s translocation K family protein [Vibrio harveyi]EKM32891.1 YOP s translocation K family protein [Vibrio harveyi]